MSFISCLFTLSSRPRLIYECSLCWRNATRSFYGHRATKAAKVRARTLVQDALLAITMPGFPPPLKLRWLSEKGGVSQP